MRKRAAEGFYTNCVSNLKERRFRQGFLLASELGKWTILYRSFSNNMSRYVLFVIAKYQC